MVKDTGVPAGYKQTEVGVIPVEWEVKMFEDIADKKVKWSITRGPFGSNLKASEYTSEGVRIIQLQNIGDGVFNDDSKIFTSDEKANELLSCNIYPNEIILSKMGDPVARACFIPNSRKRFLMSSDGIRLVVDESRFAKKFVHEYINSIYFRKRAIDASIGSTRLRIGLQDLKKLLVIAPPLPEQQAIASALSDVDALITSLEQLITKKRNIKQGAMQQLLTDKKRLPGFSGEWEVKTLENVCAKNGLVRGPFGGTLKKEFFVRNGFKVYEQKNAIYRNVDLGNYFIDKNKFNELKRFEVKNGDFIVSCSGTIGKIYQIPEGAECGIINQALLKIKTDHNIIHDRFFFYYFDWEKFQEKIIDNTQGGAMQNLVGMNIFRNTQIPLPPLPEQQSIAHILSDMDTEIEALEQKRYKYKALKQGMMQELLTGKTRLLCQQ